MNQKHQALADADEAEIQRQIAANPDAAEASNADMAQARPFAAAFPELAASIKRTRGRPAVENPRQHVSLRLDPDVLEKFKATGKGWQSRINDVLRDAEVLADRSGANEATRSRTRMFKRRRRLARRSARTPVSAKQSAS